MSSLFSVPVALSYNGNEYVATMGPFERSLERDFALVANKKAIAECDDLEKLRSVATMMMEGWSNMQEAVTALVKENLELRQAIQIQQENLEAADELLGEAGDAIKHFAEQQQSARAKRRLWPFG